MLVGWLSPTASLVATKNGSQNKFQIRRAPVIFNQTPPENSTIWQAVTVEYSDADVGSTIFKDF